MKHSSNRHYVGKPLWRSLIGVSIGVWMHMAAQPLLAKESPAKASTYLHEDLYTHLSARCAHDPLVRLLLQIIFLPPTPEAATGSTESTWAWDMYTGYGIRKIQIQTQGLPCPQFNDIRYTRLLQSWISVLFPTTDNRAIRQYLDIGKDHLFDKSKWQRNQQRLAKLNYLKGARIQAELGPDGPHHTVDIHVITQDTFPMGVDVDLRKKAGTITHANIAGWGHTAAYTLACSAGLQHGFMYRIPNLYGSYILAELEREHIGAKQIHCIRLHRHFMSDRCYAGGAELSHAKNRHKLHLDTHRLPISTSYSFYHQHLWLGKVYPAHLGKCALRGQFFVTGKIARRAFINRPRVWADCNKRFHSYTFLLGSYGWASSRHHKATFVYDAGGSEYIPVGTKVNLIGGYQLGEFFRRPYLRCDLTDIRCGTRMGIISTRLKLGGFFGHRAWEQVIMDFDTHYGTPLYSFRQGRYVMRQFIAFSYLAGLHMFTGEAAGSYVKPKSRGSDAEDLIPIAKRLGIRLETVCGIAERLLGFYVAGLGFIEGMYLAGVWGERYQVCEAFGLGFRLGHRRFRLGSVEVKLGYSPYRGGVVFSLGMVKARSGVDLRVGEPDMMAQQG
ncbi:MAG: hypothetical protein AAF706_00100 [Bacteroidota bacterium]